MILLLAAVLALTILPTSRKWSAPARCEAIARETVNVCRWPNIDGAHSRQCDRLNALHEACQRKAKL